MSGQEHVATVPAAVLANPAEIVTARKVSHRTAHAAPVTHYRSQSKSSSNEVHGSPRMMPSPKPPPCSALPPTPLSSNASSKFGVQNLAIRGSNSGSFALPNRFSKGIRKTFRQLSAGLSEEEYSELVQKILGDLRPAHATPTVRSSTRTSRPNSLALSPKVKTTTIRPETATKTPESFTTAIADERRLSSSSQSGQSSTSSSNASLTSNEKLVMSQASISPSTYSTPQLSQSRAPTPTSPASPNGHDNTDVNIQGSEPSQKDLLTPMAALERLKACERGAGRTSTMSSMEVTGFKEAKLTHSTGIGSPSRASAAEEEPIASSPRSTSGTVPGPRPKRSSSYRKSVPTLEQLDEARKKTGSPEGAKIVSAALPDRASSPSSTNTETPSWISSLTTLEAIRILAYQRSFESVNKTHTATRNSDQASSAEVRAETLPDEVSALQHALTFTLERADKLAEALHRASEEKIKVETELDILRRNVLSLLGSKNMFGSPNDTGTSRQNDGTSKVKRGDNQAVMQDRAEEHFEDTRSRQTPVVDRVLTTPASVPQSTAPLARSSSVSAVARPPRAGKVGVSSASPATPAAPTVAAPTPAKASGGVSIASLRKNTTVGGAVSASAAQRYVPEPKGQSVQDKTESFESEEDDDDDFELYPFTRARPRQALPEVSLTDFLNASRMSKTEIEQHDARRALMREDMSDFHSASSSTSSHAPLAGSNSIRSLDSNRKGIFKGITKLVDQERAKRSSRRTSAGSKPSMTMIATSRDVLPITRSSSASANTGRTTPGNRFTLAYQEESIIPPYPVGGETRHKAISLSSALSESLDKQHLTEAASVGWR